MNRPTFRLLRFMVLFVLTFGWFSYAGALPFADTAGTYYVSTTGSDNNPGTGTAPFKTFARAVSVLQPGDTLQVLPGTYYEPLTLSRSGMEGAVITVVGNGAVIDMRASNPRGISASGSYLHILGFEVTGAAEFGIHVTGRYVTVENTNLHDNVTNNGVGTCGLSTSWGSALKVKLGGESTTLRGNNVHDNCGEGIAVTRGVTALVENNTVYDNFSVNIYVDNSPFVTVQNNTSYCTGTHLRDGKRPSGIALGEEYYSGWGAQLHDILVSGNTITDCRYGISTFESNVGGTLTNVAILNNMIPSGMVRSISLQTSPNQNVLVANNLIFNPIYVFDASGVTLGNNTIGSTVPTATVQSLPTNTLVAPSFTPTSIPPGGTNTAVPTLPPPTATLTSNPSSATETSEPAQPTITLTSLPPSPTFTSTSVPPTPTFTSTSVPPTPTFTSTSIPPTPTPVLSVPNSSETIYDDRDAHFIYSSGWQDLASQAAYGGSFKLTSENGAFVTFSFSGQSFSILYLSGNSYRDMDVYLDGVLVGTIDQKGGRSESLSRWDYPGQLAQGNHSLKLVIITPGKSWKPSGSIDAVIVR